MPEMQRRDDEAAILNQSPLGPGYANGRGELNWSVLSTVLKRIQASFVGPRTQNDARPSQCLIVQPSRRRRGPVKCGSSAPRTHCRKAVLSRIWSRADGRWYARRDQVTIASIPNEFGSVPPNLHSSTNAQRVGSMTPSSLFSIARFPYLQYSPFSGEVL